MSNPWEISIWVRRLQCPPCYIGSFSQKQMALIACNYFQWLPQSLTIRFKERFYVSSMGGKQLPCLESLPNLKIMLACPLFFINNREKSVHQCPKWGRKLTTGCDNELIISIIQKSNKRSLLPSPPFFQSHHMCVVAWCIYLASTWWPCHLQPHHWGSDTRSEPRTGRIIKEHKFGQREKAVCVTCGPTLAFHLIGYKEGQPHMFLEVHQVPSHCDLFLSRVGTETHFSFRTSRNKKSTFQS